MNWKEQNGYLEINFFKSILQLGKRNFLLNLAINTNLRMDAFETSITSLMPAFLHPLATDFLPSSLQINVISQQKIQLKLEFTSKTNW